MILSKDQQEAMENAARPLIEWLNSLPHPHVTCLVDISSAELVEGVCRVVDDSFVKD